MRTGMKLVVGEATFGLFLVADGRRDDDDGITASQLVVEHIARRVISALASGTGVPSHVIMPSFKYAVMQSNDTLLARNANRGADMRSTLTGVLVCGERAYVAHVGNSRAYLYSAQGNLWQLTKDHSLAFGLVSAGLIGPTALNVLPLAQRLYRSLGDSEHVLQLDAFEMSLRPGDRLLLCSDGLWRQVCDPHIEAILRTIGDPRAAVQELQRQARQRGSPDDVSAIIVRMLEADGYGAGSASA